MSVTFRYIRNGNLVTFKDSVDIDSMRIHPEYEEVIPESVQDTTEKPLVSTIEPLKRTYRTRKIEVNKTADKE